MAQLLKHTPGPISDAKDKCLTGVWSCNSSTQGQINISSKARAMKLLELWLQCLSGQVLLLCCCSVWSSSVLDAVYFLSVCVCVCVWYDRNSRALTHGRAAKYIYIWSVRTELSLSLISLITHTVHTTHAHTQTHTHTHTHIQDPQDRMQCLGFPHCPCCGKGRMGIELRHI